MIEVKGKGGISAKIIADSIGEHGIRITTFELNFHRWILAEHNTHRVFSRNGSSSRAIPLPIAISTAREFDVKPLFWGKNQAGMQSKLEEVDNIEEIESVWKEARESAFAYAQKLHDLGLHKQWAGRLIEPFSMQKMVVTSTDWSNWYELRNHEDAQPEIDELARCMKEAHEQSLPVELRPGDWHVPYYSGGYWIKDQAGDSLEDALMISSSCAAQVSYRKSDDTLEKAKMIYERLVGSRPLHASPFEHQATPFDYNAEKVPEGATHFDVKFNDIWSGNFRGWIQHRQILNLKD